MYTITDGFVGYFKHERNELYCKTDNKEKLEASLRQQPVDWYYRINPDISYIRNNLGHRCKNIEEIDLNNYFLVTGCSPTEGLGLHLEDTYPDVLSKQLNCDYYNLALSASNTDIMIHNLLTWAVKVKQKPKFLIIQPPNLLRFNLINQVKDEYQITTKGLWSSDRKSKEMLVVGNEIGYFQSQRELGFKLIKTYFDVPIVKVYTDLTAFDADDLKKSPDELTIFSYDIDTARDTGHPGRMTNKNLVDKILKKLRSGKQNANHS